MTSFRFLFALLLAGLAGVVSPAHAQRLAWEQRPIGTHQIHAASDVHHVTDPAGNTYQLMVFRGRLILGADTLNPTTPDSINYVGSDVVLTKTTAAGQIQWYRRIGLASQLPARQVSGWAITLDPQQNVILSVDHQGAFELAGTVVPTTGTVLTKYAPDGTNLWVHELAPRRAASRTGYFYFQITALSSDAAGNLYFVGNGGSLGALGAIRLDSSQVQIALVGRCDGSTGQVQWLQSIVTTAGSPADWNRPYSIAIATDPTGNSLVSGVFTGTTRIGTGTGAISLTTARHSKGFVARFAATGALSGADATDVQANAITTDPAGNFYLTGRADTTNWTLGGITHPQAGFFVAKLAPSGVAQWVRMPAHQAADSMLTLGTSIALDGQGRILVTGNHIGPVQFGEYELNETIYYSWNAFVARFDAQGDVEWAIIPAERCAQSRSISCDAAGDLYWSGIQYSYRENPAAARESGITFYKISQQTTRLTGRVYLDANADGQRAPGEGIFPRSLVLENHGELAATAGAPTGRFHVFADTGSYDLRLPVVPPHYRLTQGSGGYQGHFTAYGQADSARHFGLAPIANQADVRVTLTPYTAARRGFVSRYRVRVENIGTTTATGLVTVALDPQLNYVGATPAPAQQTGSTVQWNLAALAPFGVRDFDVSATVPLNVALGTELRSAATATVPNDLDPTNDLDSLHQTVVGSWDPNALTVNYSTLTPTQVAAGTELDYLIQFQNLGTDTAFTVVLTDTLPAHLLQLGTLYVVSQSHNCRVELLGNNQLVVRFDGINLPHNAVSALGSGGFIRFRVKPRLTLTPGALIPNTAHILFDYNAPLATNDVVTLVQAPNGLVAETADAKMRLYPNPAGRTARVTIAGAPGARLTVRDMTGRAVRTAVLTAPSISLSGLAPGVYVVQTVTPDGGTASRRLVVE